MFLKDIFYKRYCLTMLPSNYTSKSWNTCHNVTYLPVICFVFKNSTDLKTKNSTKSSTLFCHLSLSLSIWICTPLKTQRNFFLRKSGDDVLFFCGIQRNKTEKMLKPNLVSKIINFHSHLKIVVNYLIIGLVYLWVLVSIKNWLWFFRYLL